MVKMHGPALDGSGKMKEEEVHPDNVVAYEQSGWKRGELKKSAVNDAEKDPKFPSKTGPFPQPKAEEAAAKEEEAASKKGKK